MDLLVIGIDGGDRRILEALGLPVLQDLFDRHTHLAVEEDLWSRGWAEILSGQHGIDTGAFYNKPRLDGSHAFEQSYGTRHYEADPHVTPLWKRLEQLGHCAGFMNVPTTMSAPSLKDGFLVSGAGGGVGGGGEVGAPSDALSTDAIRVDLLRHDYILDTRFKASGVHNTAAFFDLLKRMHRRRTAAYLDLCAHYAPTFGFLAYMSTTRVQYLAYSEIEDLLAHSARPQNAFQERLLALYADLDAQVGRVVETLAPEHLMLVSDHGAAPRRHTVNVNPLLQDGGLQAVRGGEGEAMAASSGAAAVKALARKVLPGALLKRLKQSMPASVTDALGGQVDWDRTQAFTGRYVSGVYVNDARRFGGPVAEGKVEDVTMRLVDLLNGSVLAREHGMRARPYRSVHAAARRADLLPDVWLDRDDTYFFEATGPVVGTNPDYGPIGEDLGHITRDQFTGVKGRHPLFVVDADLARLVRDDDPRDLRLVYHLAERAAAASTP
jgi:predicted AlkP superfamily phosphohydrolase/phosphomutase